MGLAQLKVCDLWQEKDNKVDDIFYLYGLFRLDKLDTLGNYEFEPFYFGKGGGERYLYHRKEAILIRDRDCEKSIKTDIIYELWDKGFDFKEIILVDKISGDKAIALEKNEIKKYGRINNGTGCLANLSNGGEGAGVKSREEYLNIISDVYGDIVYNMIINYIDDPLITQSDIAEAMGIPRQNFQYILRKIHGSDVQELHNETIQKGKSICYPSNIQGIIGDKLREEGIKYRKKNGTLWECENGKMFVIRKLSLHKPTGLYILTLYTKTDYIITSKDNNVYLIPFPNSDVDRIYLHYPQDLEQYRDFYFLKNLDLNGDKKESICKIEFDWEEPIDEYIPYGYCHCGCGQKTEIIKLTNKKKGKIKGEPNKYIFGHSNNKLSDDDINNIILKYNDDVSMYKLAKDYGVSPATIKHHLIKNDIELKLGKYNGGTKKGRKFSCKEKEFVCSICDKVFIKKRKPRGMICSDCRKIQKCK